MRCNLCTLRKITVSVLFQLKLDMLNSLLDIEVAYSLLKSSKEEGKSGESKDAIDIHYEKLKTDIEILDRKTEEYKILEKYVDQTHASTHNLYKLEIIQVIPF